MHKQILDNLSFGIALLDRNGNAIIHNDLLQPEDLALLESQDNSLANITGRSNCLKHWVKMANADNQTISLACTEKTGHKGLIIPRTQAVQMGFPSSTYAVLITTTTTKGAAAYQFSKDYNLTSREAELVSLLTQGNSLKQCATIMSIHYESTRTYLKCIFNKCNVNNQMQLQQKVASHPAQVLKGLSAGKQTHSYQRHLLKTKRALQIEYFQVGRSDAYPVFYFDALAGNALDLSGCPEKYIKHLNELNVQIINVCRPGTFGSSFRKMTSLSDLAREITFVADALDIENFSILSYSYGSGSALGVAHQLADRIDRVIMSAPNYAKYSPKDWRNMDIFCQMTNVIGRKWPDLYRQLLHFYIRSVLQNWDKYVDRNISRSQCRDDIDYLSSAQIRRRSAQLLNQRTMNSMDGFVQENFLYSQGWDFSVADIDIPVMLFHGDSDNVSPAGAARLLASELPNARLFLLKDLGHYYLYRHWSWLVSLCSGATIDDVHGIPAYTEL